MSETGINLEKDLSIMQFYSSPSSKWQKGQIWKETADSTAKLADVPKGSSVQKHKHMWEKSNTITKSVGV